MNSLAHNPQVSSSELTLLLGVLDLDVEALDLELVASDDPTLSLDEMLVG